MAEISNQIVTLTLNEFRGWKDKYWAFTGMQLSHKYFADIPGLSFYKILGTGGGSGFRWYPNFSIYAILTVWESEDQALEAINQSNIYQKYQERATQTCTLFMKPVKSHGVWSGSEPFIEQPMQENINNLAVLTRATIRTRHIPAFWKKVGKVSEAIQKFEDCKFAIGVGEWPVFQQATFSIWNNLDAIKNYAYEHPLHKEVVKLTREKDWYSEELFARFQIYKTLGYFPRLDLNKILN